MAYESRNQYIIAAIIIIYFITDKLLYPATIFLPYFQGFAMGIHIASFLSKFAFQIPFRKLSA
jgi:hypothetical protein